MKNMGLCLYMSPDSYMKVEFLSCFAQAFIALVWHRQYLFWFPIFHLVDGRIKFGWNLESYETNALSDVKEVVVE